MELEVAHPGDSIRIMPVKDVIEPRVKTSGDGGLFPGIISKVATVGSGRTNVLRGCGVVTAGKIVGFQEGIIDMERNRSAVHSVFAASQSGCCV